MQNSFLGRFIVRWAVNAVGLWLAAALLSSHITYTSTATIVVAGLILALLNMLIKPLLILLSLPALVLSLGLFMIIINGLLVYLASLLYTPLHITSFWAAVFAGLIIGLVNWTVATVMKEHEYEHI